MVCNEPLIISLHSFQFCFKIWVWWSTLPFPQIFSGTWAWWREKPICQSRFPEQVQGIMERGWQERCAAISPGVKGGNMNALFGNCSPPPPPWPKHDALQQSSHAGPASFLSSASEGERIFKILKKITLVWYQSTSSAGSASCLWQQPTADA